MHLFSENAELAVYNSTETVLGILAAFFAWTTIYFVLCLVNSKRSYEWNCRMVSTLHAMVVVFMSYWCAFVQGTWPFTDFGSPNSKLQHWTCVLCLGYFIWDLVWCLYFQTEDAVMLFHHILSLYGNIYILASGHDGVGMIGMIFGAEISNPFLQMRWFFRTLEMHHSLMADINDHIFMLLFGIVRIGIGSYFLYSGLTHPDASFMVLFGGFSMYIVGWLFWIKIVAYAIKKYKKKFALWSNKESRVKTQKAKVSSNGYQNNNMGDNIETRNGFVKHGKEE